MRVLRGFGVMALAAQGVLAWVLYRYLSGEPGPDLIDPFRWGGAALAVSLGAGLVAMIGGFAVQRRPGAGWATAIGLATVALCAFEGIFFAFIYFVGKGNPR
jgi:hypothetical protein